MKKRKQKTVKKRWPPIWPIAVLGIIFMISLGVWSMSRQDMAPGQNMPSETTLQVGQAIYAQNCAACHGAQLEGQPDWQSPNLDGTLRAPPHDATGHTWHHNDSYLLDRIQNGAQGLDESLQAESNMPAYAELLSEAEIVAVLEFIKSTWPPDVREMQASR